MPPQNQRSTLPLINSDNIFVSFTKRTLMMPPSLVVTLAKASNIENLKPEPSACEKEDSDHSATYKDDDDEVEI